MALFGCVVLLESVWTSSRKYVAVEVGFEVSYMLKSSQCEHSLLLPIDQDIELSVPLAPYLLACHNYNGLNV